MDIIPRYKLIEELKGLLSLVKECPKDMYFHVNVEFSGIDPKFMELASRFNAKKLAKREKEKQEAKDSESNL